MFPSLITPLCQSVKVPFDKKANVEITPSLSIFIRCIEAKFQRDKDDRARKKLVDSTLIDDVETLKSGAAKLAPKVGILSFSPSLASSSTFFLPLLHRLSVRL